MEILMKILQELYPDLPLTPDTELTELLDSFDIVTLTAEIDGELGVAIPVEELVPENFRSARALLRLVDRLR